MISDDISEHIELDKTDQNDTLKKKIFIQLLLPTLILVPSIICCIINQNNDYDEKSGEVNELSHIVIQTLPNKKRKVKKILADTLINT